VSSRDAETPGSLVGSDRPPSRPGRTASRQQLLPS
jgi:hypothetical protein